MLERDLKADILKAFGCDPDLLVFKNEQGTAWLKGANGTYHPYAYGLGVGTGDLILGVRRLIKAEHVGRHFLQFGNAELKRPGGEKQTRKERLVIQKAFAREVSDMGGCSGFVTSVEEFGKLLEMF